LHFIVSAFIFLFLRHGLVWSCVHIHYRKEQARGNEGTNLLGRECEGIALKPKGAVVPHSPTDPSFAIIPTDTAFSAYLTGYRQRSMAGGLHFCA
jgi:hypothetical protein